MILTNAFSLNMIDGRAISATIKLRKLDLDEARWYAQGGGGQGFEVRGRNGAAGRGDS